MGAPVRVIARLDIKGPNLIKGIQFDGHRVLGVPEEFAEIYYQEGVDELIFQDTVASLYQRNSLTDIIQRVAKRVFVPLTVAGGLRSVEDIHKVLRAGADKVALNTAAMANPQLIEQAAKVFGSQCIVASIEAFRQDNGQYQAWVDYGPENTERDAIAWAKQVVDLGAGEILLTSINRDGLGKGYDLELIDKVANAVSVPVIACGGAGKPEHAVEAARAGADALAAASVFHYHYMDRLDDHDTIYKEKRLRMGEHVDTGNRDFIKFGYGGVKSSPVSPCSIQAVKQALKQGEVAVRLDGFGKEEWA